MAKVDVVVVAEKGAPYCASCGGGRTLEEITQSMRRQLMQSFGDAVSCRFVDVREFRQSGDFSHVHTQEVRLPLVLIDGKVRYRGLFSPTFIRRDVRELLERSGYTERQAPKKSPAERPAHPWVFYGGSNWATDTHPAKR